MKTEDVKRFILNLEAIKNRRHYTLSKMARETGTTAQQLCGWLSGKSKPSIRTMERISDALEVDMVDMLNRDLSGGYLPAIYSDVAEERLRVAHRDEIARKVYDLILSDNRLAASIRYASENHRFGSDEMTAGLGAAAILSAMEKLEDGLKEVLMSE